MAGELVAQAAGAAYTVLVGHCIEAGAEGLPLAPLVDALRTLARTTPPAELTEILGPGGRGLARLLPEFVPEAAAQLPDGCGYLFAGIGAGGLIGTTLASRALRFHHQRHVLAAALAAVGLPMPLLAIVR